MKKFIYLGEAVKSFRMYKNGPKRKVEPGKVFESELEAGVLKSFGAYLVDASIVDKIKAKIASMNMRTKSLEEQRDSMLENLNAAHEAKVESVKAGFKAKIVPYGKIIEIANTQLSYLKENGLKGLSDGKKDTSKEDKKKAAPEKKAAANK